MTMKPTDSVNSTAQITNALTRNNDPLKQKVEKFKALHSNRFHNSLNRRRVHNDSRRLVEALNNSKDDKDIHAAIDTFINSRLTNHDFKKSLTTHMLFKAGLLSADKVVRSNDPQTPMLFKRK